MKKTQWIVTWIVLFSCSYRARADDHFQILSFKTHSRFVIHVDESVPVELKTSDLGFELLLKGIGWVDLGIPAGSESSWKEQYQKSSDPRIQSIEFEELSQGIKIVGRWKFPTGKLALLHPAMESFEYHEKNPSQYVVDFWPKPSQTIVEHEALERQARLAILVKKNQEEGRRRLLRKLASEKRQAEAENPSKFCEKPLNETNDVFLEFYPAHQKVDFTRWFANSNPDTGYSYRIPEKNEDLERPDKGKKEAHSEELKQKNKEAASYVRLAHQLYRAGKLALTIRTLDFFDKEHAKSEFRNEMKFLRANALIKLGMIAEGELVLNQLMTDAKGSQVAQFSATYLVTKMLEKNQTLPALETFLWLSQYYSDAPLNWVFHLGAAESLFALKQTERAAQEYQWVIDHAPGRENQIEGAFRLGDVFFARFQYEQALAYYFQGSKSFQDLVDRFPTFILNRGETFYQLGQFDKAKQVFEQFIQTHPNHSLGWRASYRLGEIYGREIKTVATDEESRKWYYHTINRYPFSPGATLARIRLLPCGDHGGFNMTSQERFFSEEAKKFDGGGDVVLKDYDNFKALAQVRTILTLGSAEQTLDAAIQNLPQIKSPDVRRTLSLVGNHFFQKIIFDLLARGNKYGALQFYQEKVAHVPVPEDPIEYDYLLRLSQAAADLGLGQLGEELSEKYREAMMPKKHSFGRKVASEESSEDKTLDIESRLKVSEQKFTEAKNLWISLQSTTEAPAETSSSQTKEQQEQKQPQKEEQQQAEQKAQQKERQEQLAQQFEKIRALLSEVESESKFNYEKEIILGVIDEREKKLSHALGHVARAQLLKKSLKVDAWLASLEAKAGDSKIALNLLKNLEADLVLLKKKDRSNASSFEPLERSLGVVDLPSLDSVLLSQGEILEKMSRWGEAANTYSRAIEAGLGGNQAHYEYAKNLMKLGSKSQKTKALEVLEKLSSLPGKSEQDDFWKKLARETLADEKSKESVKNAKEGRR